MEEEKTAFYLEYAPAITDIERLTAVADICKKYFKKFICIDDFFFGRYKSASNRGIG